MKISELTQVSLLSGAEKIPLVQDGTTRYATADMLRDATPDHNGVYPDVPLNRITIKRTSEQESPLYTAEDNVGISDIVMAMCYPCLVNRDGKVAVKLNGNDCTKTADGTPVSLHDPTLQAMVAIGGFYKKYIYDSTANMKITRISPYKVRGYKYVRRRFYPMFAGSVVTDTTDGVSKNKLVSNDQRYTKQSISVATAHQYAKYTFNATEITSDSVVYARYAAGDTGGYFAWKNGTTTIYTQYRNPIVGAATYSDAGTTNRSKNVTYVQSPGRAEAMQDAEVYTLLFSMAERTTKFLYDGINALNYTNWGLYDRSGYTDDCDGGGGQSSYGQVHLTGVTLDILGHKGEKEITVSDFPNGSITCKPNKWLWCENRGGGMFAQFYTGRLFYHEKVYQFDDLNKIAFTVNSDAREVVDWSALRPETSSYRYIKECFEDTIIPTAVGGSSSTYYCDGFYQLATMGESVFVPLGLGNASYGTVCGLRCLNAACGSSSASARIGVSLVCDDLSDSMADGTVVQ